LNLNTKYGRTNMSDIREITVPDIGELSGVEVIEVLVAPGDTLAVNDPMITLESDKASMDVPSPSAGVVKEVRVSVGDAVSKGDLVLLLEMAGAGAAAEQASPSPAETLKSEPLKSHPQKPESRAPDVQPETPSASAQPTVTATANATSFTRVHASPSVRRLARERDIDLNQVVGSGRKGRITREDLGNFAKSGETPSSSAKPLTSGAGIPAIPAVDFAKFGKVETLPLSKIKRLTGTNLSRAWLNVPHVTHHDEADITELEAFRQSLKAETERQGLRVTLLSFFMKACAAALKTLPTFNASLDPAGENLILKHYRHIGIAVDTPSGLVVPVVRDVDRKSINELSAELAELSAKARDKKLMPGDMQGGTFTISSLGGIGGTAFTPIVNAPEVAILGLVRSQMKPVWNGSEFVPRLMQPLSLSYDHRVIDGAEAARFVRHLGSLMSDVRRLLL
jgi:pyruvate dehydrogenase E2 component (dihydrolipoamide acetyltransferase)